MAKEPKTYNGLTPKQILKKLVVEFFWNDNSGQLEWSYKEGMKVDDIDPRLGKAMTAFRDHHEP